MRSSPVISVRALCLQQIILCDWKAHEELVTRYLSTGEINDNTNETDGRICAIARRVRSGGTAGPGTG